MAFASSQHARAAALKAKPGKPGVISQAVSIQDHLYNSLFDSPVNVKATLVNAWISLENLKREIRGIGKPKAVEATNSRLTRKLGRIDNAEIVERLKEVKGQIAEISLVPETNTPPVDVVPVPATEPA